MSKPSGKRPAMFMQWAGTGIENDDRKSFGVIFGHRIRIVYPDGKIEWMSFETLKTTDQYVFNRPPCYIKDGAYSIPNPPTTFNEAMCVISDYDRQYGFEPMEFIGEIEECTNQ
jgi:hypothetical protein